MTLLGLLLILAGISIGTGVFIWFILNPPKNKTQKTTDETITEKVEQDVEHIFNDEFREELRNRGRLHFEKIIGENAMFLQQDLRLTTSQLNEYMKDEITRKLHEEFEKYEQSITDAKQLALESINKTQEAVEQQRQVMTQQLGDEIAKEKKQLMERFENNMADIVNHYVLAAVGDQIDLNDQLDFILADLEANKEAIVKDISSGA